MHWQTPWQAHWQAHWQTHWQAHWQAHWQTLCAVGSQTRLNAVGQGANGGLRPLWGAHGGQSPLSQKIEMVCNEKLSSSESRDR